MFVSTEDSRIAHLAKSAGAIVINNLAEEKTVVADIAKELRIVEDDIIEYYI